MGGKPWRILYNYVNPLPEFLNLLKYRVFKMIITIIIRGGGGGSGGGWSNPQSYHGIPILGFLSKCDPVQVLYFKIFKCPRIAYYML